ncbi:Unconventional myosin-XVIIIa [Eufriesea mexicana]|uniref:unconventional myosin-XVIIIa-like isoform X1 n=1 Tax=Eufriesea mexicana TaxID=516756 RepID=UPI00083BBBE1|nr:PREDICTED: unconventional myosin-XVIIIa-like isoform X1 [Eufriesea mexicana]XP_017755478.1 PREDICTED: unconventional myosin-XVIIIa-like isoform X1 [Eufriesea mexicana]OAD58271.1 Unconventional myosin-XVIIIa [Eufriesea mexicana]
MLENVNRWPGTTGSRLVKARSSPNVSKAAPLSIPRKQATPDQSRSTPTSKSPRVTKTAAPPRTTAKIVSNDHASARTTFSAEPTKTRASCPSKSRRSTPADGRVETARCPSTIMRTEKRQVTRSISSTSSCTILEDRTLLKKGLSYAPAKLPKKPEALRKKASLDRSVSLGCVSVDIRGSEESFRMNSSFSCESSKPMITEKERKQEIPRRKAINRSASLWSVQAISRNEPPGRRTFGGSSRPSKIPLLAHRNIRVGRSLADLSQVDRAVEPTMQPVPFNDVDLDRSMDERIYENCREAFSCSMENRQPTRTYTSNLEERVARLMAQLDDDVDDDEHARATMVESTDCVDAAPPRRANSVYEVREIDVKQSNESNAKLLQPDQYTATVVRIEESLEKPEDSVKQMDNYEKVNSSKEEAKNGPNSAKGLRTRLDIDKIDRQDVIEESKKKKETSTIKELRKNWEKQANGSMIKEDRSSAEKKVDYVVVPATNSESLKPACQRNNEMRQEAKSKAVGKRTKEIEHLVNFFNCKNAEASKEVKDPWIKTRSTSDTPTIEPSMTTLKKSVDVKSIHDYNGYTSDGNCSEDSGHMSNENEVEWKDGVVQSESRDFGKERFFEQNDIRQIGVFDATSIVSRLEPEKKPTVVVRGSISTSSGASSIDSCKGENAKTQELAGKDQWKACRPYNDERQIFFRSGTLERLEAQRDEKLTGHIILLQARCRGYLARRKLNTLKLQDLAVRCIQRNVRKWMSVREWPWWRLYVKVAPLLNVHRTEDQLKAKTEELEILRTKVERLEQERNHLKHDNDKLEAKLSEMTADFAEEHSTSTLAAERIDAETSERLRLERELQDVTEANKNLQQTTERLEMELLYARAADLNGVASDAEDGEDGGVYKQRYEHAVRELEFTKRKMAQQHEDDLEQLVGLKKQLEKKLADAYEEVEEQRQVVGQWKRRVQKLNGEMHDLRLLLEEQTARNNLLEKKQRKFDSETQNLMNDLRQEKAQRERLAREKEIAIAEKFTIEQNLSDARLEIELKEERLRTLSQELEELTFGGKTEEEVAQLKKAKHELEKRAKDQEEELDDLAGQVQLLEQAKLRLEMSIEQQRKEIRKEMQQRDEELEDVRGNALKKVKALESQLENEHEERTILLREKHELERRLVAIEEQDRAERAAEAETTHRLKRDLKRTKALLRDAQTMLERSKGDSTGKAALRQLKNQLEDAECARAVAVKAKQALEQELNETQASLEEALRQRSEAEERANVANRERTELLSQLEENEEELAEVLKKYRAAVQQVSAEQGQLQEAQVQIASLEAEKSSLKDQLSELTQRLESVEQLGDPTANSLATRRLEFRAKELESKLELEQTTRARLETQIARLKENVEKLQTETALLRTKEQSAQDAARRLQRSLREAREEASAALAREQESTRARREMEKSLEAIEAETKVARDDLRLALQRVDDLQSAIQGELDLDCSEEGTTENSDSD